VAVLCLMSSDPLWFDFLCYATKFMVASRRAAVCNVVRVDERIILFSPLNFRVVSS